MKVALTTKIVMKLNSISHMKIILPLSYICKSPINIVIAILVIIDIVTF